MATSRSGQGAHGSTHTDTRATSRDPWAGHKPMRTPMRTRAPEGAHDPDTPTMRTPMRTRMRTRDRAGTVPRRDAGRGLQLGAPNLTQRIGSCGRPDTAQPPGGSLKHRLPGDSAARSDPGRGERGPTPGAPEPGGKGW